MLRLVKRIVWAVGFIIGCRSAFGFALIGPVPNNQDVYQVPDIGYALGTAAFTSTAGISTVGGYTADGNGISGFGILAGFSQDMGTPKKPGDGYRRNTPIMYYSFDPSFLEFFGEDGAAEVDKALAIYNSVTNVSSYSPDLSEFPDDSRRINVRAATAALLDIKSVTMGLMTEQLGFWQPVRWVWSIDSRVHLTGTGIPPCPGAMEYVVDKKNLDIHSTSANDYLYSSYVNDVLYSYTIGEICSGAVPLADALEFPVDPVSAPYSAVADFVSFDYSGLIPGTFYTSLTRDDVAGLRYLIRQNNLARETTGARTLEFITNTAPAVITTSNLTLFAAAALTNDPVTLATLYPGLIVTSSSNFFGLVITTNITQTLVNAPLDPAGAPPSHPLFTTNYSTNFANFFQHTFGNLVTNSFATRGAVGSVAIGLTNSPFSAAGTLPTVTTNVNVSFVNGVFGDFFLLPTNLCGAQILSNFFTQVLVTTNPPTLTGGVVGGATNSLTFTPGGVNFFTNHAVVYLPVTCPVDAIGTFGGVEKIRFIRRDYDSLINQAWDPVTNDYTLLELTNSALVPRHMQRAVPRPDFLFTVTDLTGNNTFSYSNSVGGATEDLNISFTGFLKFDAFRTINFNQTARSGNRAGPGTIESPLILPTLMVFNRMGPLYFNQSSILSTNGVGFLDELGQTPFVTLSWGSFDGSTNAPVVYPNGHSITELENLLTGPAVTTSGLPSGNIGTSYSAQLAAIGGHPPYTWSLAPGSPGLPAGLNISPSGLISGTPTGPAAIYDFTVRLTDSGSVFKDVPFVITLF